MAKTAATIEIFFYCKALDAPNLLTAQHCLADSVKSLVVDQSPTNWLVASRTANSSQIYIELKMAMTVHMYMRRVFRNNCNCSKSWLRFIPQVDFRF